MTESETTKNTLYQLEEKMNREHWGDIQLFEDEDSRYSIAVGKAILLIKELEQYKAIGTVEEFKALKEKNEPKKVQYDEYGKEEGYPYCKCGKCLIDDLVGVSYCPNCGKKLYWERRCD